MGVGQSFGLGHRAPHAVGVREVALDRLGEGAGSDVADEVRAIGGDPPARPEAGEDELLDEFRDIPLVAIRKPFSPGAKLLDPIAEAIGGAGACQPTGCGSVVFQAIPARRVEHVGAPVRTAASLRSA